MENQNKQRGVERELKELVQKYNVLEKGQIYAIASDTSSTAGNINMFVEAFRIIGF